MPKFKLKKKDNHNEWKEFVDNFLLLAELGCAEILEPKHKLISIDKDSIEEEESIEIYSYGIPVIYNMKHAIEILLKQFIRYSDGEKNSDILYHDIEKVFKTLGSNIKVEDIKRTILKLDDSEEYKFAKQEVKNLEFIIKEIKRIAYKYYELEFLDNKINLKVKDVNNTVFKYPENKVEVEIDYIDLIYDKITIDVIETVKEDISELRLKADILENILFYYNHSKNNSTD